MKTLEEKLAFGVGLNGTSAYDIVSKPKHYMLFDELEIKERAFEGQGIEVRDVLKKLVSKFGPQEAAMFISDYVQMMQYGMRFMEKNGLEDLKKMRFYLDEMIDSY